MIVNEDALPNTFICSSWTYSIWYYKSIKYPDTTVKCFYSLNFTDGKTHSVPRDATPVLKNLNKLDFFSPHLSLRLWQWPAVLQSSRIILCSLSGNEEEDSASSCAFSILKWRQIVQKVLSEYHQPCLPVSSRLAKGSSSCWGSCLILRG